MKNPPHDAWPSCPIRPIPTSANSQLLRWIAWVALAILWFGGLPGRAAAQTGLAVLATVARDSANGKLAEPTSAPVTVFKPQLDGYPAIRIPAIVSAQDGSLLAFAEGRQGGDHSENDLVLKRSSDLGKTWSPLQVVHEAGVQALGNPQPVVLASGRILIMYQCNPRSEHNVTPGFGPLSSKTWIQASDDHGVTWSAPRDITRQIKRPESVTSVAAGPGIGIVLTRSQHRGRIVMPLNQGPYGDWRVYAAYSDDGGESWQMGETAPEDGQGHGNEVQMVELSDGRVMLNARTQGGGNKRRKVAFSKDGGVSWTRLRDEPQLIEPVCQAGLLRYSWPEQGQSAILFSNPTSENKRENGQLHLSSDEGQSWRPIGQIYPAGFAYSCLVRLSDDSVGVLFERDGYRTIDFVAFAPESVH